MRQSILQTRGDKPGARWQSVTAGHPDPEHVAVHLRVGAPRRADAFRGFGGAFTESAAWVFSGLGDEVQQEVLSACFSPQDGLGYTYARTHMNSCDFSLGNYSAVETPGDTKLWSFFCEQEPKYLWPFMDAANAYRGEAVPMLLSPWSPPAWMKTNNSMNNGGSLRPEYRDAWARYFCRYILELQERGFSVFGITVQNEPEATQTWDSCRYSASEEAAFIRDYLGPELHRQGLSDVALYCWDHNRDLLWERVDAIMKYTDAARYITGAAIHWYADGHFDQVEAVKSAYPDLEIVFTEGCIEGGVKLGQWDRAERYAKNIIGDLNAGVTLWLDWNLMLDTQGGPNHVGNYCDAPLIANPETGEVHYQPSYDAIGHFSRYIHAGARCLQLDWNDAAGGVSVATRESLSATAFENLDGTRVTVLCNAGDEAISVNLDTDGGHAILTAEVPGHSITTCILQP
ncbi:MAG: glucosylceramidase [Spirochaetaceae bacterium]|nr:MAG: glucosylceramidase [Spirochaetaceae bacterium]